MNKEIKQYIIDKYCGGRANTPPAKNIQICLQPGYELLQELKEIYEKIKKEYDNL